MGGYVIITKAVTDEDAKPRFPDIGRSSPICDSPLSPP